MKKIYFLLMLILTVSCTNLQEEILDEQNGADIVANEKNAEMLIAPAYAYLRDLQSRSGVWLVVESCTDEMVFPTRGANWNSSNYRTLYSHDYDPLNLYIKNTWNSFMIGMTKANVAINYLKKLPQSDKINGYINEARFVRALCVYQLNDLFGQVPFRSEYEDDFSKSPVIMDRATAVNWLEKELKEIIPTLKNKSEVPYGRITKAAAQTLLAKLYINYQVYTGKAPAFTDGVSKWTEVISICNEIINSNQYILADDFWKLYLAENSQYSHATESILPILHNSALGMGGIPWVNMTLGYNQIFGTYPSPWNGCCTTPDFVNTWDQTDPRFQDNRLKKQIGFNLGFLVGQQYGTDGKALLTKTKKPLIFTNTFKLNNSEEEEGVRVVKYAPDPATAYPSSSENDYQYYRLTDIYLMRAEAYMRSGNSTAAATDLNTIRTKRNMPSVATVTLTSIYNERGYEFYWEHHRRNDMVRFNTYCSTRTEKPTVTPAYKILLPIPLSALEADVNLHQNPGY